MRDTVLREVSSLTARRMRFQLLVYRMPLQPAAARVAVWRLLKKIGAVYPQQSVCVFPDSASVTRELQPILRKIEAADGEYHLLPLAKLPEEEERKLVALFVDQAAKHYQEIVENCEVNFTKEIEFETARRNFTYEEAEEIRAEYEKIVTWFNRVRRRDWFGAPNRAEAETWLQRCEHMLEEFEAQVYEVQAQPDGRTTISVLLFDFGGVIAPLADEESVARHEAELGLELGTLHPLMYEGDLWPDLSVGKLAEEEYWQQLGTLVGHEAAGLRTLLRPIWDPLRIDQKVIELIRAVRPGVRVALLSNATLRLEEHLAAHGIADLFDPIINSARVGLRKPDPAVFEHALRVLGAPAEQVLLIDDKERNTRVAQELGMRAVVFENAQKLAEALRSYGVLSGSRL